MQRDKNRCTVCKSKDHLHVHHKTYNRFKNELLTDLITLCSSCHSKVHSLNAKLAKKFITKKVYNVEKSTIKNNVLALCILNPECVDSYNLLVYKYWQQIDGQGLTLGVGHSDAKNGTNLESIVKAFRMLVADGSIKQTAKIKERRKRFGMVA